MRSFLVLRKGTSQNPTDEEKMKKLVDGAKFMVKLRKDLNGGETDISAEDYLKMILNDWETSKEKVKKYL